MKFGLLIITLVLLLAFNVIEGRRSRRAHRTHSRFHSEETTSTCQANEGSCYNLSSSNCYKQSTFFEGKHYNCQWIGKSCARGSVCSK